MTCWTELFCHVLIALLAATSNELTTIIGPLPDFGQLDGFVDVVQVMLYQLRHVRLVTGVCVHIQHVLFTNGVGWCRLRHSCARALRIWPDHRATQPLKWTGSTLAIWSGTLKHTHTHTNPQPDHRATQPLKWTGSTLAIWSGTLKHTHTKSTTWSEPHNHWSGLGLY